jgi:predicted nucleic acid-binding protein
MIILDTNVLFELMRVAPDPRVTQWVAKQPEEELFTTSVSEAEIFYGIDLIAPGKRRESLLTAAEKTFTGLLLGRVLAFESEAARPFSRIVVHRRALGRPVGYADAQIASIARVSGATLATRDTDDFEDCGIEVVNPWSAA